MAAVSAAYARLEGHFTFVVIHQDHPNHLVGVRHQTPMVVGLGDGENFLASNLAAFLAETRRVQFPGDGEVVSIKPGGVAITDAATGAPVEHDVLEVDWDDAAAERSGYETFMLKEIYEQPEGVAETIGDRVRHGHLVLDGLGMTEDELQRAAPHRDRRVRHLVPRRRRRAVRDRGVGARPGRARRRERMDLPQPGRRSRARS